MQEGNKYFINYLLILGKDQMSFNTVPLIFFFLKRRRSNSTIISSQTFSNKQELTNTDLKVNQTSSALKFKGRNPFYSFKELK